MQLAPAQHPLPQAWGTSSRHLVVGCAFPASGQPPRTPLCTHRQQRAEALGFSQPREGARGNMGELGVQRGPREGRGLGGLISKRGGPTGTLGQYPHAPCVQWMWDTDGLVMPSLCLALALPEAKVPKGPDALGNARGVCFLPSPRKERPPWDRRGHAPGSLLVHPRVSAGEGESRRCIH